MMKRFRQNQPEYFTRLMAASLLIFTAHHASFAQPMAPAVAERDPTIVLTWNDTWQLAIAHNENHQLALQEREKAHLQVLQAWSAAMPTLNLQGTFNHYFMIPSNPVTMPGELNFENPGEPFTVAFKFGLENNILANAQLTQPLWLAGKVGLGLKLAKQYQVIAKMGVEVSEQDLHVALVKAFYGALIADEYVDISRQALDQAQRHQEQVQALFDQGVVSEYDLIRARVAVSNLKPGVVDAETMRDLAYKGLKNLIGMDLDTPVKLKGEIRDVILKPELGYDDAAGYAEDKRLELQQLELQKKLFEGQRKLEERSWLWPNLLAGFRWETQAQSENLGFADKQFFNGTSAQLIINIPLFDGFAAHRRAQIAEVNLRNVELQRTMLDRGIRLQVFQATRQFDLASEKLQAATENRDQAEKGYSIAETRYSSGIGTQLEVLDAQLQLNSSRLNVLQAQYDQIVARSEYDRALGQSWHPDSE